MKLAWLLCMSVLPCFSQELRMADAIDSLPPLCYPPIMRIAKIEGYVQAKVWIGKGQIISLEGVKGNYSTSTVAIDASKKLLQLFKFKEAINGLMSVHLLFRMNPPKAPGSIPSLETTIDWQSNTITFNYSPVIIETMPLN